MSGPTKKMLEAQRDEARKEADRLYRCGEYLAAACRFYAVRAKGDRYYTDAWAAVNAWEKATEEFNAS